MSILYNKEHPWISEREVTICCWESDKVRGDYTNPFASIIPNIYQFSRRQMQAYLHMMKELGFTGVQLIDSCYSWCQAGSVEAFHDRLIMMAEEAKNTGLQISLWVWASFFGGHGWHDPDAAYIPAVGFTAFTDPKVHACFNKYYDIYAELAPYVDRLIGHFFDPGLLTQYEDILAYMKLLADKFKAKNPKIKMAVDTWGSPPDYPDALARSDLGDFLLMEQPSPDAWPGDSRASFRRLLRDNHFQVGMWGWYTVEYESDQMAAMYVNGHVLKDRYNQILAEGDAVLPVSYWSEMEACHLVNIFSLYCAAQLLIDPTRDPDELLREITNLIWRGPAADVIYDILKTIEDIRSGDTWDTYWWTKPRFRWGTDSCHADLVRIEEGIAKLEPLILDRQTSSVALSLPVAPWVLASLIRPHLEQMRQLACFKVSMSNLEKALADRAPADQLYRELDRLLIPVPNFNTWVGNFLQIEQREQYRIAIDFCKRAELPVPVNPFRRTELRRCALEKAAVFQKGLTAPFQFNSKFISENYLAYSREEALLVMESMYQDKLIDYDGNGFYHLINWQDYKFNFDIT